MFITFEGIDGSGKSTQARILFDRLISEKRKTYMTREPGGTEISENIRSLILDVKNKGMASITEFLLFSAARSQHVAEVIKPKLADGVIVICDRFYDSSLAYQGYGGGMDIDTIKTVNNIAAGNLTPDMTFFIDIPFTESLKRRGGEIPDRIESKTSSYFESVIEGYKTIAKENTERFVILDGSLPPEELARLIYERISLYKLT